MKTKMTRMDFKKRDIVTFQKLMRNAMKKNLSSKTNWGRNQKKCGEGISNNMHNVNI